MAELSPENIAKILNVQGMTGPPSYQTDPDTQTVNFNFPGATITEPAQLRIAQMLERHMLGFETIPDLKLDEWISKADPEQISRDETEEEVNEQVGFIVRALLALGYLTMREINLLREENGWSQRTERQFWQAIKAEIQDPHFEVPD